MAQKNIENTDGSNDNFVFDKVNYRYMLISIAIVILGFILMIGETDIYDFRKTVLAPMVVLAGFGLGFFAILKKHRPNS
jgi:hypothetical protein